MKKDLHPECYRWPIPRRSEQPIEQAPIVTSLLHQMHYNENIYEIQQRFVKQAHLRVGSLDVTRSPVGMF